MSNPNVDRQQLRELLLEMGKTTWCNACGLKAGDRMVLDGIIWRYPNENQAVCQQCIAFYYDYDTGEIYLVTRYGTSGQVPLYGD